ncbi:MAG: carboxymuconolactone decarboxylase family protein [Rhodobacter sp.]|uniref:carboxymuconolactone decarboxylase family protein n=1 Tax=Pararhodobacter sp. TaxID=2127056 RepID=UPI001DB6D522|nr:carboxymuconolactone decarboxylase family protein [Pararhodobacter sp.]MCB1344638.1 carboxymuconolactone decarboxylase family protein [Paracoccaceae bacterium]MCC0073852.1 carboxymuconolactone decarboxylase family protein [Rhodobacter sp.]HPD94188.1 carboxymuconolactone decarboxylase family protein [Pararhodobacter sp.]
MNTDAYTKMFQQMLASGQEMLHAFNPAMEQVKAAGFDKLVPTLSKDMMEMWFGKAFNREGLDAKTRLLVTLAALVAQGAVAEPQVKLTVRHALEAGATQREIMEVIWQMSMFGGLPAMQKALDLAQSVFAEIEENDA